MNTFIIKNIGYDHEECFFIEIKNRICRNVIMVDGGKGNSRSLEEIKDVILEYEKIDYLIITHIDQDHLLGVIKLFEREKDDSVRKAFEETVIIYNYVTKPFISYRQAKKFEKLIIDKSVVSTIMNNYTKYSSPCLKIISSEMRKALDPREQGEYAVMTLLHPKREGIEDVYKDYLKWDKRNDERADSLLINRQSIVFLLEYGDKCVLFAGDCDMNQVMGDIDQLKNMKRGEEYRKIDLIKLSHHGAYDNNRGLPCFARNHKCTQFYVTGKEEWDSKHPSLNLLKELVEAAEEEIKVYTHVGIDSANGYHIFHQDETVL